jgi:cytosine/adenosine deaminase-related metal-dependent hydrolase
MSPSNGAFDAAYLTAQTAEAPPPARELRARLAPAEAVALKGCVLTPAEKIDPGYVVVESGTIQAVQPNAPQGVPVTDTGGVITPGLIDLHGHPEFNVFAAWEPPRQFDNRYEWRASTLYHTLVRDPQNTLLAKVPKWTQLRYAEVRALVSGVTAIQGSGDQATQYQDEALVRNVDKWIFGSQVGRAMIDLPSGSRGADTLKSVLKGIADGKVQAFYVHLAEGRSDNDRSAKEFDTLVGLNALTDKTVVIHGTALSEAQLGQLKDAGAKLVWSPQSNLRLYDETTRAAHALQIGLPVGLGADWLPSGSTSLLAELTVARHQLAEQSGAPPDDHKLVDMVTRDAAAIAGLGDKLGVLEAGRAADIAVFERRHDDPWTNVVLAEPASVELVMIGGDIAYGHRPVVASLLGDAALAGFEAIPAWGKPMVLDTGYQAHPGAQKPPTLTQLRADLIANYPQVGPIFA